MKTKLIKNKKKLQQKFSRKVLVPQTTADFTSRVNKSYVPFTCKFIMVMRFVPIQVNNIFFVYIYDITSLKFCASFRFCCEVFMEKILIIRYLNYVRRGVETKPCVVFHQVRTSTFFLFFSFADRDNTIFLPLRVVMCSLSSFRKKSIIYLQFIYSPFRITFCWHWNVLMKIRLRCIVANAPSWAALANL